MQKNKTNRLHARLGYGGLLLLFAWLILPATRVWAANASITDLNFSSLAGDMLRIELTLDAEVAAPTVFQTDNPARLALDFNDVRSGLDKKRFPINQSVASNVFVVEAGNRTRVVVNLTQVVPYETRVVKNKVYIILNSLPSVNTEDANRSVEQARIVDTRIAKLLPEQTIKNIDFRRGTKGEGRLLLGLSSPNTVVDVQERGGKVVLNFLNTHLPDELIKTFDVIDFATPVHKIDTEVKGKGVVITISTVDGNYDYSSYQSEGLLTVDFVPLTPEEKEIKAKERFPYTGSRLSLNFQNIPVRSVLQILADFTELNIIAADSVSGSVTLRLNDVPWDQALDLILKSRGLAKRETGNVVLVAPTSEIMKIEEQEVAANKVVAQLEPLKTEYIQINYAKAIDIQKLLVGSNVVSSASSRSSQSDVNPIDGGVNRQANLSEETVETQTRGVLSERGSSTVDTRTNMLIVKDTSKHLEQVRKMIRLLDIPVQQVMIEARIVVAEQNFAQNLGVRFGVAKAAEIGGGKSFAIGAGPNTYGDLIPDGNGSTVNVPDGSTSYLVDLGASAIGAHPVGALGMTLARGADYVLNLELSALENENRGEILANPRVLTSDRVKALIRQGTKKQVTVPGTANNPATQRFVNVVLELDVTPQITPNGDIIMDLVVKKDDPVANSQDFTNREIHTNVQVKDGETIVLGGVYEGTKGNDVYKIPFFADLPGIGFLFKKKINSEVKRELLIFVTPKIVKDTLTTR